MIGRVLFLSATIVACMSLGCGGSGRRDDSSSQDWPGLVGRLPELDTSKIVRLSGDTFRLYRTDIQLVFKAGISQEVKAEFFRRRSMTVTGVTAAGVFFVRIPDPGPTAELLFLAIAAIRAAPEVDVAAVIPRSEFGAR